MIAKQKLIVNIEEIHNEVNNVVAKPNAHGYLNITEAEYLGVLTKANPNLTKLFHLIAAKILKEVPNASYVQSPQTAKQQQYGEGAPILFSLNYDDVCMLSESLHESAIQFDLCTADCYTPTQIQHYVPDYSLAKDGENMSCGMFFHFDTGSNVSEALEDYNEEPMVNETLAQPFPQLSNGEREVLRGQVKIHKVFSEIKWG
jgi:hypothetical protein